MKVNILIFVISSIIGLTVGCNILNYGVSPSDKQFILDYHNRLRQKLALGQIYNQPQAANMQVLVWDDELANVAQRHANGCEYYHNPYRHISRFYVGENIARIWSSDTPHGNWKYIIDKWFGEYSIYRWLDWPLTSLNGHYTQIAWGTTTRIGCGYTYYLTPGGSYTRYYVCNYGPTGNHYGVGPYEIGTPNCARFGLYYSRYYNGLCSSYYY
ncbi:venom allergen 5-like [Culicoides brevitarsis]|uniref:venom allergen 5-like n=1 Tax=Culicoides brevitarsis TaxID=469753 RepID=UPI00307B7E1A